MAQDIDQNLFDYLEGNMSPEQEREYQQAIDRDPDLQQEIRDLKALELGLKSIGAENFKNKVGQWESEVKSSSGGFGWNPYLAVAAAILVVLIPAIFWFQNTPPATEELFLSYYQPYENVITVRGEDTDSLALSGRDLLLKGLDAYSNGAFAQSSDLLSQYLDLQPEDHRVALYLAITQLELNLPIQAEANFLKAQQDPLFKQQAQWYRALSYLKFDDITKAKTLLEEITQADDHYRSSQAGQLLEDLL